MPRSRDRQWRWVVSSAANRVVITDDQPPLQGKGLTCWDLSPCPSSTHNRFQSEIPLKGVFRFVLLSWGTFCFLATSVNFEVVSQDFVLLCPVAVPKSIELHPFLPAQTTSLLQLFTLFAVPVLDALVSTTPG